MQAPASELPGSIFGFRKNILLAIAELGYWQGMASVKFLSIAIRRLEVVVSIYSSARKLRAGGT
jgi:hypothetical protein